MTHTDAVSDGPTDQERDRRDRALFGPPKAEVYANSDPAPRRSTATTTGLTASRPDPTYAWCVALLPLASVLVAWLAPAVYAGSADGSLRGWVVVVVLAANIGLCLLDSRRLRAAGFPINSGWVIAVPVYLFMRSRDTRTTVAIPVAWVVTFLFSILALSTFAAVHSFSGAAVGNDIAEQLRAQPGGAGITVTCPDMAGHVGDSFNCIAQDKRGQSGVIRVTLDAHARYTWVLVG